jgi:hypothetical protein
MYQRSLSWPAYAVAALAKQLTAKSTSQRLALDFDVNVEGRPKNINTL